MNFTDVQHTYLAYGLVVLSDLRMPELAAADGAPDVIVRLGTVPEDLRERAKREVCFQTSCQEFLFNVDGVALFYIARGNEVVIEPIGEPDEAAIRLFLLGSAFCALLQQRGYLVLHGASLEISGKGVLLTGPSGIGKSTLAAAFYDKGHRVLSDDVCVVKMENGRPPRIVPGFPSMKLWKDAAEWLGKDVSGLAPVRQNVEKYRIGAGRSFLGEEAQLHMIFELSADEGDDIRLHEVTGLKRLETIMGNTYRYHFVLKQGEAPLHFRQCASLAGATNLYRVVRPAGKYLLEELMSVVKEKEHV